MLGNVHGPHGFRGLSVPPEQPTRRRDPERTVLRRSKIEDRICGKTVEEAIRIQHGALEAGQPFAGTEPQGSIASLNDAGDSVAGQAVRRCVMVDFPAVEPVQAVEAPHPNGAVAAFANGGDGRSGGEPGSKDAIFEASDAAARTDPETAIPAGDERIDEIVRECFVANPVEDGHAETVESRDAFFCAEPEIAIHGLRDGIHGILGKPVVIGESGLDVLMHGAGPIQSGACGSKHTGQDKQH